jgi:nucleoside phosphorylase
MVFFPYWLVPQGAEFQAVRKGIDLAQGSGFSPQVIPIPLGSRPLDRWLPQLEETPAGAAVLLLGVAGSLNARFQVPDWVISSRIQTVDAQSYTCEPEVLAALQQRLPKAQIGQALCSDRILTQVSEKQSLGSRYGCDLVEMEGAIVVEALQEKGLKWAMNRVISDDLSRNIPDLSQAILPEGGINGLAMAAAFLREPIPAFHFIRGSLQALASLQTIAQELAQADANF